MWGITPPMVLLAWLRSMSGVSLMAAVGNASVLAGMAFTLWFSSTLPSQLAALPLAAPAQFGSYFGSVAFLFFIHFTLPAIESGMAVPARFMAAVVKGFALCAAAGALFGTLCAAAFGPSVSSLVITQLGSGAVATAVKLLLCLNLLFTFPIICRSAFLVVEQWCDKAGATLGTLGQRTMRTAFVVLASATATGVPSFGSLLSLVSGVSLSLISLVLPTLILLLSRQPGGEPLLRRSPAERVGAAAVCAVGLAITARTLLAAGA